MSKKKQLGQFFTTNYVYILQNLHIPDYVKVVVEPFCGNGDLLKFLPSGITTECYDIDPKKSSIVKQDTLLNPVNLSGKFLLTNPPYLARNKSQDKTLFDKYACNDLYKCFIKILLTNKPLGGILIIPLNFWSSIRVSDIKLRKKFLSVYDVMKLNIFEERVFCDTSYTVCSFQFIQKQSLHNKLDIMIYPSKKRILTTMNSTNNYIIGGEIYKLIQNKNINISRLTRLNKKSPYITNILLKCIDDNKSKKISLQYVKNEKRFIDKTPNLSARTYATLCIEPQLSVSDQKELIARFNTFLNCWRKKYNSLFLTNYRESKDISRKRISFKLAYQIVSHLLLDFAEEDSEEDSEDTTDTEE